MNGTKSSYGDTVWSMVSVYLLMLLGAPWWGPLILIGLWGIVWASSTYANHLERRMDREYPGWRTAPDTEAK